MTLAARVRKPEAHAAHRPGDAAGWPGERWLRERGAFLALVSDDSRAAVAARLGGPYGEHSESLSS